MYKVLICDDDGAALDLLVKNVHWEKFNMQVAATASNGKLGLEAYSRHKIDLVILAGFLAILSPEFTKRYENRIINVHPSLIPSFCGDGFYGLRVHQAALDYGVKVTGATVHFVNEVTDGGKIILQKAVEILPDDTAESLQKRVMEEAEWQLLPQAAELFCSGKLN